MHLCDPVEKKPCAHKPVQVSCKCTGIEVDRPFFEWTGTKLVFSLALAAASQSVVQ